LLFVLVLMPKEGALGRWGWRFDYEHEHPFKQHEHERMGKDES
jgi:hypothetical protein